MAQGVGSSAAVSGGQDVFGGHLFGVVDYKGPASYVQKGDAVDPHAFGFPNNILTLWGSVDQSDTYFVVGLPVQSGVQTAWQLVWMHVDGTGEVAASTNLSTFTVRLGAIGI